MWKQPNKSKPESEAEPIALQNLKRLIAVNVCKCKICDDQEQSVNFNISKKTQVKKDRTTNVASSITAQPNSGSGNLLIDSRKGMCPGCYMALNLLRQKELKYLKDEMSETNPYMFSCDKSTTKLTFLLEKFTSPTNITVPRHIQATVDNIISELIPISPIKNNEREEIRGVHCKEWQKYHEKSHMPINGNLCMEQYVNSIRTTLPKLDNQ